MLMLLLSVVLFYMVMTEPIAVPYIPLTHFRVLDMDNDTERLLVEKYMIRWETEIMATRETLGTTQYH